MLFRSGESTTDLVFAGNGIVVENGVTLRDSERFSLNEQLIVCDVDIEKMRNVRRRTTTFASNGEAQPAFRRIPFALPQETSEKEINRHFDPRPFVPADSMMHPRCQEIFDIQVNGLAQRFKHTHSQTAVIGISGGLDSTLALLVCIQTFDKLNISRERIVGVTMPGFGTTDRTYNNAVNLMTSLGVTIREITIKSACMQDFEDLGIEPSVHDVIQ